jgi:hypothetical protein
MTNDLVESVARVETLANYADGWKGPGSFGTTTKATRTAVKLANAILSDERIELPHIGLAADGEINFFWKNESVLVDLSIAQDGTFSIFAQPKSAAAIYLESASNAKQIPKDLIKLLRALR